MTLENSVTEGPRETVFRSIVKDVTIDDMNDPSKLEGKFSKYKLKKVYVPVFIYQMKNLLEISEEDLEDLQRALCEHSGACYIKSGYVRKV